MKKTLETADKLNKHEETSKPVYIALSVKNALKVVKISDIVYLQSSGRYTTFNFQKNSSITVCKNLGHYEKLFRNDHFLRIHHSFLINISFLESILKDGGGQYCEMNFASELLPISNRRFKHVKEILHS